MTATASTVGVTDVVAKYIKARDIKARLDKEHKERCAPIVAAMDKAEAILLQMFQQLGIDSAGCEAGTAYTTVKTSATVEDMDAFLAFVKENDAWHFLERRVSKTAVDEFVNGSAGDLPPGVKYSAIKSVNVRRAS